MSKKADNAWKYEKYTHDVDKARRILELIITQDVPRHFYPDILFEVTKQIVDYKIKRAEAYKIDFYFDD